MRLLCEIFILGALIYFGWEKPFRDWVPWTQTAKPAAVAAAPAAAVAATPRPQLRQFVRPAPTPSGDWMWDPSHRSTLDRPAYESKEGSQRYKDSATGQKYWIDSRGIRHGDASAPPPPPPPPASP